MRGRRRNVGLSSLRLVCNDRIFAERRASLTSCLLTNHRSARSHSTTNTSPATCSATSHGNSSSVMFVSPLKDRFGSFEEEVQKWDPSVDVSQAPTPPSSWYISPEFLRKEASTIFHNNWLQVGRSDEVAKAGDYITGEILGEPYIVVRGEDGQLRAFFNVCRHHASKVALGAGCAQELVCPYHGWTYRLDGKLKLAPRIGGIQEFKARDNGLKPMAVTEWGRWIFVNVDAGATWQPSQEFNELEKRLEKTDYKSLKFGARKEYRLNCNWKVYVDNYLDGGYHVEQLHKSLNAQLNTAQYVTETFGKFSLQSCPGVAGDAKEKVDEVLRDRVGPTGAYYAFLYPNFMINRYGDILDTNLVIPISEDKTLVYFDYFYDDSKRSSQKEGQGSGDTPAWLQESIKISDQIQDEDAWISESVQKGLSSSAYNTGRYAPKVEMAAFHFHQLLRKDYEKGFTRK